MKQRKRKAQLMELVFPCNKRIISCVFMFRRLKITENVKLNKLYSSKNV